MLRSASTVRAAAAGVTVAVGALGVSVKAGSSVTEGAWVVVGWGSTAGSAAVTVAGALQALARHSNTNRDRIGFKVFTDSPP